MDFAPLPVSWFLPWLPLVMNISPHPHPALAPQVAFDRDVYHRNRETKMGYYLIKEGTGGLSPPMAERLTSFGAELAYRHGASKTQPMCLCQEQVGREGEGHAGAVWYAHGEGRKQILGHGGAKVTLLPK